MTKILFCESIDFDANVKYDNEENDDIQAIKFH